MRPTSGTSQGRRCSVICCLLRNEGLKPPWTQKILSSTIAATGKRDEAVRARQNQRFARKQAAREHDSRLVAALAERSKAALKRCQAAEKKVRACARAAKLAAGDARHIEGLVRDTRGGARLPRP